MLLIKNLRQKLAEAKEMNIPGITLPTKAILVICGYRLPKQFHVPPLQAYISHYIIIATLIAYAWLTIVDIHIVPYDSYRAYALWTLSTLTIIFTLEYKKQMGKQIERRNKANKNNRNCNKRRKKEQQETIFNKDIYKYPLKLESVLVILAVLLIAINLFVYDEIIICLLKITLYFMTIMNCFILSIDNIAEFYHASDFKTYKGENENGK